MMQLPEILKQSNRYFIQIIGIVISTFVLHALSNQYLGIPWWVISNFWGISCLIVFMDSVVLQNDYKMLELKLDELVQRYTILEEFRQQERNNYIERENKFLNSLSNGNTQIMSELSSLCSSVQSLSSDSQSHESTPEQCYTKIKCKVIPPLQKTSPPLEPIPDKENANHSSKIYPKQCHSMSLDDIFNSRQHKVRCRRRRGLGDSHSEIISTRSSFEDQNTESENTNDLGSIRLRLDLTEAFRRPASSLQ